MKKIFCLLVGLLITSTTLFSQECIDALIIKNDSDTLFCKIMMEDSDFYTVDNGIAISSISKNVVVTAIPCARLMTLAEMYRFKGIDFLTQDNFTNTKTSGYYFRKAATNIYISSGLTIAAGTFITIGALSDKPTGWYITGGICAASSFLFAIIAWNNVYRAGKLMDINKKSALYLTPTEEGNLGLQIKF